MAPSLSSPPTSDCAGRYPIGAGEYPLMQFGHVDVHLSARFKVTDLAHYLRPLPGGYWAVPPLSRGMRSFPKIPRPWSSKIVEEYAAGMPGPKLTKKYGVGR